MNDAPARPPFPFIVGSGRSGTTLVRAMLDSHPSLAVPPETYFVVELLDRRPEYEASEGFSKDAFLRDLLSNQWFRRWDVPPERVTAEIEGREISGYADAIRAAYAVFARTRGKDRYADKTPVHIYHLPVLADLFPEGRFVHVIRDGRDVAASFLDQDDMRPNGMGEAALLWRERVSIGRTAGAELGPDRYLELRYEELVKDPRPILERLCATIGLSYDPSMLSYSERAAEVVARDGGPERHRGVFMPPTVGLRDWREELAPEAVETFELVAGDLLTELGYERATDTSWADGHPSVRELIDEVERLRREDVALEAELRQKLRRVRANARAARRERRRGARAPDRPERREAVPEDPAAGDVTPTRGDDRHLGRVITRVRSMLR
jgi:hypothetical protein